MAVLTEKRCTKCGGLKPVDAFYTAKNGLAGCRPECKSCNNAYHNEWARNRYVPKTGRRFDISLENRARRLQQRRQRGALRRRLDEEVRAGVKVCRACGKIKALDCYKRVGSDPPRFDATCKICRAEQARMKSRARRPHLLA